MRDKTLSKQLAEVDTPYGEMSFFLNDEILGRSLEKYGEWGKNELDFLHRFIDKGMTVVDAGGFIGSHTLAFASFVGARGKVYAFEPHPVYFKVLEHNCRANQASNVLAFNLGLSDREMKMWAPDIDFSQSGSFGSMTLRSRAGKAHLRQ